MKKRYAILCGLTFLLASCSKDKTVETNGEIPVKIMARSGGGNASGQSLNTSEDVIRKCRVYIFDASGKLDRMQLFEENEIAAAGMNMRAKVGAGKKFCIVVNEVDIPRMKDALDRATSPGMLHDAVFALADYVPLDRSVTGDDLADGGAGYILPMYGESTVAVVADDINQVSVELHRAVARVDIYLRRKEDAEVGATVSSTSSIELGKVPAGGYFAPDNNPVAASGAVRAISRASDLSLDKAVGSEGYQLVWSFYVPSQRFAGDDDRYRMTVKGIDWEGNPADYPAFRFGDAISGFDNTIVRNTRYEFYCTLSRVTFRVDMTLNIEDWGAVSQDSHI